MKNLVILLGRWFICAIFLLSAVQKILAWDTTSAYMASAGLKMLPILLAGAIVVELFGGLSLFIGSRARFGALVLALYLIPVTVLFHNFWALPAGALQDLQVIMFLKNLAIFGGLLLIVAEGPGTLSADHRRLKRQEAAASEGEEADS